MITHKHHIQPKHMDGDNSPSNIVKLSVLDHAAWHYELWCYYGKIEDKIAWKLLLGQTNDPEVWLEKSKLGGLWHKGKKSQAKSLAKLGKPSNSSGKKWSQEQKEKLSIIKTGSKRSSVSKQKMGDVQKKTYLITYPDGNDIISFGMPNLFDKYNITIGKLYALARNDLEEYKGFKVEILSTSKRITK